MMSALRARRQPRSLSSDAGASRSMSKEYDDNGQRDEDTLEDMLPARNLASGWVDIDDADGSEMERGFDLLDADLAGVDITVPVIPKRADEFTCSSCFLIHHVSRLAISKDGQLICTDCA
jgi:Domain of unknown function (DUF4193)